MRQIKKFMEAKRPMWNCNECKCITLQCWRENDEFCNCGTSSEGLGVEYSFKNWNGKVLKQGSIEEGATPTPPADPTREATAEYTYTFAGWDPEVGPINEDTVYTATYTATVNEYDITIESNDTDYGTVDVAFVEGQPYGTAISAEGNVLTIGEGTSAVEVTATAEEGYEFDSWGELPATVTGDLTITATFKVVMHTVTFSLSNVVWDENEDAFVPAESQNPLRGSVSPASVQVQEGWTFSSFGDSIIFFAGSEEDEDAITVTVSVNQGYTRGFPDAAIEETSGITYDGESFRITGDVSDFPIFFEEDSDEPGE